MVKEECEWIVMLTSSGISRDSRVVVPSCVSALEGFTSVTIENENYVIQKGRANGDETRRHQSHF